jgi:hypothetical protein
MAATSPDSMEPEVLKAMPTPAAIRRIVLCVTIGLVVIFLGKVVFLPWLKDYVSVEDRVEALFRFKIVMFGIGASLLPVVTYLSLLAVRIIRSRQFPPPGARVLRDTPIVRGKKAVIRGLGIGLCAVWLLGCAIFSAVIPYMLSDSPGVRPNGTVKHAPSHAVALCGGDCAHSPVCHRAPRRDRETLRPVNSRSDASLYLAGRSFFWTLNPSFPSTLTAPVFPPSKSPELSCRPVAN